MLAFYDFDGTLASSNVVSQYGWLARHLPCRRQAAWRTVRLLARLPLFIALNLYSRRRFNEVFYREYAGLEEAWLYAAADRLFAGLLQPALFPAAHALVAADRAAGRRLILVSGSLDFALAPVVRHFGFDDVICNVLEFSGGVATGALAPPIVAEATKADLMREVARKYNVDLAGARAYSDSLSDLPMLEACGAPFVIHPDARMRRLAAARGWPVLDLRGTEPRRVA